MPDLDITLDFTAVGRSAERVRDMLLALRDRYDLSPFEYTKQIRIAPTELPYSHPVITLNTWISDELSLLSSYLHEQMHWYVTWYSHAHTSLWRELLQQLRQRYPTVPIGGAEGGNDEFSTYLHLVVNRLEIEAAARFVGRDRIVKHVAALQFYRGAYKVVVEDSEHLGEIYFAKKILPFRYATEMSPDELKLAASPDEMPT